MLAQGNAVLVDTARIRWGPRPLTILTAGTRGALGSVECVRGDCRWSNGLVLTHRVLPALLQSASNNAPTQAAVQGTAPSLAALTRAALIRTDEDDDVVRAVDRHRTLSIHLIKLGSVLLTPPPCPSFFLLPLLSVHCFNQLHNLFCCGISLAALAALQRRLRRSPVLIAPPLFLLPIPPFLSLLSAPPPALALPQPPAPPLLHHPPLGAPHHLASRSRPPFLSPSGASRRQQGC